mmetsp:Transcript_57025/g.101202  ORF Transcript_57025/g.101202 Transcript_57025/m.101202 type:complete len:158 (+) Transcript_57025:95-568(+)
MAASDLKTFNFEGKTFPLWTDEQLRGVSRDNLLQRALNIREHVGKDRLPTMLRGPDEITRWILNVQGSLAKSGPPLRCQASKVSFSVAPEFHSGACHDGGRSEARVHGRARVHGGAAYMSSSAPGDTPMNDASKIAAVVNARAKGGSQMAAVMGAGL